MTLCKWFTKQVGETGDRDDSDLSSFIFVQELLKVIAQQ